MIRAAHLGAATCLLLAPDIPGPAAGEQLRPVLQQPLPDSAGKQFTVVLVDFAPGESAAPHRHGRAFVYAYVVAGETESRLDDQPAHIFGAGQSWAELPGAHHVLTRNLSTDRPARLLVVFVADQGAVLKTEDP